MLQEYFYVFNGPAQVSAGDGKSDSRMRQEIEKLIFNRSRQIPY
jgi:hypothetical protein